MGMLQAQNVHYIYQSKYQKVHAVKGINFDFEEGKFYAIVGKSGCGKTTFLSLLAGLDLPTEGSILYDGKSTAERNRDEYRLRAISLICQSYNLFPLLTVEENVTYPMLLRGVSQSQAEKTAREKLKDVGLNSSYYKRLPAMLSGGEQQRVAIASAIASDKQVIVFDEPTSGLDYRHMKKVAENLRELSSLGKTLFIVTHDPELIAECCNYFVFIENGKVLWSDGWNRISRERLQKFFAFEDD